MNQSAMAYESDAFLSPRAMILYEDVAAAKRALHSISKGFQGVPEPLELRPRLWQFQDLQDPDWFCIALAEATDADIVAIATSSKEGLIPLARAWIKLLMRRKRGTDAAIVALFGPEGHLDGHDSERLQFLHGAVQDAGLDFFAPSPGGGESRKSPPIQATRRF